MAETAMSKAFAKAYIELGERKVSERLTPCKTDTDSDSLPRSSKDTKAKRDRKKSGNGDVNDL